MMFLFLACAQPVHLQYDFGRATWEAQRIQADLARASVQVATYPISGLEAEKILENKRKAATDVESGAMDAIAK